MGLAVTPMNAGAGSYRRSMAAVSMAAPAVVVAAWIVSFELALDPPYRIPEPTSSFSDAVQADAIERAFGHIRSGEDPNAPVPFRDDALTGGREIMLTPMLIAVAADNTDSVSMLMSSGVRMDAPGNRFAVCLARRMGHGELAVKIVEEAGPETAPTTCPDGPPSGEAPLSVYVE